MIDFADAELKKLYDLLVLEAEGREEHDLDDDPDIDSAFAKIAAELKDRRIS